MSVSIKRDDLIDTEAYIQFQLCLNIKQQKK